MALSWTDTRSHELFMARDPYGIKPLYYAQTATGLIFASQVKALLSSELLSQDYEWAGVAGFYLWGSVPEPWTLYRGIFALPAGCWLKVHAGVAETPVSWNDIRQNWQQECRHETAGDPQEVVRQAVTDSVRAHLVSDVPVCVFLSGGIDSAAVAGLASELGAQVEGITIEFDEFSSSIQNEVPDATRVAKHFGLRHHVRKIKRAEFEEDTPQILDAMDLPSIDGVNTWFAAKVAAERGYKVALSGVGGDELFHGYRYMRALPREIKWGKAIAGIPGVRSLLKRPCAYWAERRAQPKFRGVPEFMGYLEGAYFLRRALFLPEELPSLMGRELAVEGLARLGGCPPGISGVKASNDEAGVCLLDSTLYLRNQLLRDSDWASMRHSLELRTPLVDAKLLEALSPIHDMFTGRVGKTMLAKSPAKRLPEGLINRPKTGFSIPMDKWVSEDHNQQDGTDLSHSARSKSAWARQWARVVLEAAVKTARKAYAQAS